jgi:glycosyltransferase 2 family protein
MNRILLTILQVLITVLLLWWIFKDPAKRAEMATALHTANYIWLLPGVLCVGIAFVLQTERWRLLLAVQGIKMGWWRTFRVFLIGAFFNLFLLGATGGDVVKIFYAMRETASKKSAAFLSVLVDRMMGLVAMVAVTAVLCSLRLDVLLSQPLTKALLGTLLLILGASLGLIMTGFLVDRFNLAHRLPTWLPLHGRIIELSTAFSTYARNPAVLLKTFGLSVPAHLLNFLAFYFAALAFGAFGGVKAFFDFLSALPIILTIAALPISLSGLGVREKLFENVFTTLFQTAPGIAPMISITGFLMTVFWGVIGGLVYLAYRPSGGLHLAEVEAEVEAVEKSIERQA